MKAHQVEAVAGEVPKLFGPKTIVIPMQNGIPYWYFHGTPANLPHARAERRPSGAIYENIPCEPSSVRVYPAAEWSRRVVSMSKETASPWRTHGTTSERVSEVSRCFVNGACRRRS